MKKLYFFGLMLLLSISSCDSNKEELQALLKLNNGDHKLLYVANYRVDCVGEGNFQCLQVKEQEDAAWQNFYGPIKGFDYEEGYEYLIEVSVREIENPPADGSSLIYSLVKIWKKE